MDKATMDNPDQTKTVTRNLRLQIRIIKMAQERAFKLGMKLAAYISQLIAKDCEGG